MGLEVGTLESLLTPGRSGLLKYGLVRKSP
jgi:hypothetical protein